MMKETAFMSLAVVCGLVGSWAAYRALRHQGRIFRVVFFLVSGVYWLVVLLFLELWSLWK